MSLVNGIRDYFGLDIGTSAIRVVQLQGTGDAKTLLRYGYMPIEGNMSQSDSAADRQRLAQAIKQLINTVGIPSKNVAVGIPSQRVFTTLVDLDKLSDSEIAQSLQLQADSIIPMPLEEVKYDWAVVGSSPEDANKVEVLLSSVPNNYVEARLDMLESIGLNVIAFEPDSMSMVRSLIPTGSSGMHLVLDMGDKSTDLVVTLGGAPRLVRSIPTGSDALIKAAMQNLNIDESQAKQFVSKFGLSKDKLEGQIRSAIIGPVDILMGEIEKSINFVKTRYPDIALEKIVVTGGIATLPELPLYIANKFGISVEIGNAWRNVAFPQDKQNELLSISNQFSVAVGLAERNE